MGNLCCSSRREKNKTEMEMQYPREEVISSDALFLSSKSTSLQDKFEKYLKDNKNLTTNMDLEKFECFSEIYKTSLMWNKILFAEKKKSY